MSPEELGRALARCTVWFVKWALFTVPLSLLIAWVLAWWTHVRIDELFVWMLGLGAARSAAEAIYRRGRVR